MTGHIMAKMILAGSAAFMSASAFAADADYPIQPVPFTKVRFTSGLLAERQEVNRKVTIPFALKQCIESNRLKNFDLAAETMRRRAAGETTFQNRPLTTFPFDDTDIYKFLEGASYSLQTNPDPELQKKMEDVIQHVKAAQEPDGYLYTFRTMHPDSPAHDWIDRQRWLKDPNLSHETYNLGHFYECATAYYEATGDRTLLDMAVKSAELLNKDLGGENPCIAPGHQIVEMGLAKLYRQTGDPRWLKLAAHFLENKAKHGPGDPYSQSHKPVLQQDEAVGHAVRANYMYAGMADVAALSGDQRYVDAITKIWDNVVGKKYHLTGGCGARSSGEAYGNNYELPNRCYNETCAAVAFLFWTHRMFLMYGDAKYMDTFERTMYNGAFSGVSLSGDRFFYPNLLESSGSERSAWFGCACCPPNIMRTIASLGQYVCAKKDNTIYMLLYSAGTVDAGDATFTTTTNYPWDGKIEIALSGVKKSKFALALRIPGWVEGHPVPSDLYAYENAAPAKWTLLVNGKKAEYKMDKGFAVIDRTWKNGDKVTLDLPMEVRRVKANEKVGNLTGQVAFERGPIVFAFEQKDQGVKMPWRRWFVTPDAKVEAKFRTDLFPGGGVETLEIESKGGKMTAIPYAWWANRGSMPMRVWVSESDDAATHAANKSEEGKVTVSYARGGMNPAAINDGFFPQNPTDIDIENFDFWSHLGGSEWVMLSFDEPVEISRCKFYWFDDSRRGGGCAMPQSWTLSYDREGQFVPVETAGESKMDEITFKTVKTKRLRLDIRQRNRMASGLYEWLVF